MKRTVGLVLTVAFSLLVGTFWTVRISGQQATTLMLAKTADQNSVSSGAQIGFGITLMNTGTGTAFSASITDNLPGGSGTGVTVPVTWSIDASSDATCSISGNAGSQVLTCGPEDLGSGSLISVHVSAVTSASSCGRYRNTATYLARTTPPVSHQAAKTLKGQDSASVTCM
jgi:uncharacterized repeat protein (TIGR01451 family)